MNIIVTDELIKVLSPFYMSEDVKENLYSKEGIRRHPISGAAKKMLGDWISTRFGGRNGSEG